jgi:hypothetical protein
MAERQRLYIDVDKATLRKLILWAASKGEKKNSWAKTVITLECEENFSKVEKWLEDEAKNLGVSKEDLEAAILKREKFDFEAYRQEMLNDK